MVLENIIKPTHIKRKPGLAFIIGFIYALIATVLGYFVFPADPSLSIIFLTTLAALPLLVNVLIAEEEETIKYVQSKNTPIIGTHLDVFLVFAYMFLGFMTCFLIAYTFLPAETNSLLFSEQIKTIKSILGNTNFQAKIIDESALNSVAGRYTAEQSLQIILFNNFKVLLFSILFSFLYGAGAIFILAWNSSILAVAMGNLIRSQIVNVGGDKLSVVMQYFKAGTFGVLRYFIHGLPEIFAYFFGAVAGGIISAAVIRHDYRDPKFYEIIMDSMDLIALACLMVIIGAILEVSVTPWIFSKL